jgi:hypothetical protein
VVLGAGGGGAGTGSAEATPADAAQPARTMAAAATERVDLM